MKKKKKDEKRKRSVISMTDELRQKWEEELSRKRDSYNNKPKVEEREAPVAPRRLFKTFNRIQDKATVDEAISCFTWPNLEYNRSYDLYLQRVIGSNRELMNYYHQKMNAYFGISHVLKNVLTDKKNERSRISTLPEISPKKTIIEPKVVRKKVVKEEEKPRTSSFEVLQKKDWILDWNCVKFKSGYFIVVPPEDGSVKFKTKAVPMPGVMVSFNYLKEYLNNRLEPVRCFVEKYELEIYDTIRLNAAIERFATESRQKAIETHGALQKRIQSQKVSFNAALSRAQQMTAEDFQKYKSKYIDFLVKKQGDNYKIIPCVESLAHLGGTVSEYAFLFSINCKSGDILIVHENVNPDRATILFMVQEVLYDHTIRIIYDFLQGAEINKRSSLREGDVDIKTKGLVNYWSFDHDDINTWQRKISGLIDRENKVQQKEFGIYTVTFSTLSKFLRNIQTKEIFPKARPFLEQLHLPCNRKLCPKQLMEIFPESWFYTDSDGKKRLGYIYRRKKYTVNSNGEKIEVKDKNGEPVYEYTHKQLHAWSLKIFSQLIEHNKKIQER